MEGRHRSLRTDYDHPPMGGTVIEPIVSGYPHPKSISFIKLVWDTNWDNPYSFKKKKKWICDGSSHREQIPLFSQRKEQAEASWSLISSVLQLNGSGGVLVAQSCPTLCDPMDSSLPSSSVHGILQARILRWVTIPFSRMALVSDIKHTWGMRYPGEEEREPAVGTLAQIIVSVLLSVWICASYLISVSLSSLMK